MDLLDSWKNVMFSQGQIANYTTEIEYKTAAMRQKRDLIVLACNFWEFVRTNACISNKDARRKFLVEFTKDENPFIATVATLESLPDSVWRRILWRHNIDFLSFESFLRRITPKQSEALRDNFDDLFVRREVPRIFTSREKDKFSVENLLEERIERERRYLAKGSWVSNLLDLDFGYNAYSNGVYDDNRNVEPERIRSVNLVKGIAKLVANQNNKNDFIVDTEFGKYFWLYTKARSNYVVNPNKEINLKTHICPGFWYTLIVHLIFWVISPLSAVFVAATAGLTLPVVVRMPALLMGAITPLWTLAALVKLIGKIIIPEKALQFAADWIENNLDAIQGIGILVLYVASPVITGLGTMVLFEVLQFIIGTPAAVMSVATFLAYLGHRFYHRVQYTYWPGVFDMPGYISYMILASIGTAILRTVIVFRSQMWDMIVGISLMIWQFAYNAGSLLSFMLIPMAMGCLMAYFTLYLNEEKQEKVFQWIEKHFVHISLGMGVICTGIIISSIYQLSQLNIVNGEYFLEKAIALFLVIVSFAGTSYATYQMRPVVKKCRRAVDRVNSDISRSRDKISCRQILKNKWLKSLEEEVMVDQLSKMRDALCLSFSRGSMHYAYQVILPKANEDILNRIDTAKYKLRDAGWRFKGESTEYLCRILFHLIEGKDFDEANKLAQEEMKEEAQKIEVRKEKWRSLFSPLTKPFRKMWEYVKTLERLYDDFNELCPNIFKPKVLDADVDD